MLFSDIQGFTLLSEKLDPQEVADLLTSYFTLMTEVVFAGEGTLDKFMGDGLVAIFGAPFPYPDHPLRAVRAGLEMLRLHKAIRGHAAGKQEVRHPDRDQYRGNSGRIYGLSPKDGIYDPGRRGEYRQSPAVPGRAGNHLSGKRNLSGGEATISGGICAAGWRLPRASRRWKSTGYVRIKTEYCPGPFWGAKVSWGASGGADLGGASGVRVDSWGFFLALSSSPSQPQPL